MPLHDHRCTDGHIFERFVSIADLVVTQRCYCGADAERVFLRSPMGFVQADICYDSPIDGRPITSKQSRIEDLARSGCVEYEPSMPKYAERKRKDAEAALERSVDETVDRAIHTMPSRKRERLAAELGAGMDVSVERTTADKPSVLTEIVA